MNDLRDLVITVDGYSVDKTGFNIISAWKTKENLWNLTIEAYKKEGKDFSSESDVSMLTLVERIENKYGSNKNKWAIVKIEELTTGSFELKVKKVIDEKEDSSDEKEDSSDEKEHVEAEE